MIQFVWLGLFVLAGCLVTLSIVHPHVILNNQFVIQFVNHELVNSLVVIVTVTLPVGITLIDKLNLDKESKLSGVTNLDVRDSVFDLYRNATGKISTSLKLLISFLFITLLVFFINGNIPEPHSKLKAGLLSIVMYLFIHSVVLMVEMYLVMANWRSDSNETEENKKES